MKKDQKSRNNDTMKKIGKSKIRNIIEIMLECEKKKTK